MFPNQQFWSQNRPSVGGRKDQPNPELFVPNRLSNHQEPLLVSWSPFHRENGFSRKVQETTHQHTAAAAMDVVSEPPITPQSTNVRTVQSPITPEATANSHLSVYQRFVNDKLQRLVQFAHIEADSRIATLQAQLWDLKQKEAELRSKCRTDPELVARFGRTMVMKQLLEIHKIQRYLQANLDLAKKHVDGPVLDERIQQFRHMVAEVPIAETTERTTHEAYTKMFDLPASSAKKLDKDRCSHCHSQLISVKKQGLLQCPKPSCARATENLMPWTNRTFSAWSKPSSMLGSNASTSQPKCTARTVVNSKSNHSMTAAGSSPRSVSASSSSSSSASSSPCGNGKGTVQSKKHGTRNNLATTPGIHFPASCNATKTMGLAVGSTLPSKNSKAVNARLQQFREGSLTPPKELIDQLRTKMKEQDRRHSPSWFAVPKQVADTLKLLRQDTWLPYKERIANLVNNVPDYLLDEKQVAEIEGRLEEIHAKFRQLIETDERTHFYVNFYINQICTTKGWTHMLSCFPTQRTPATLRQNHAIWHKIRTALLADSSTSQFGPEKARKKVTAAMSKQPQEETVLITAESFQLALLEAVGILAHTKDCAKVVPKECHDPERSENEPLLLWLYTFPSLSKSSQLEIVNEIKKNEWIGHAKFIFDVFMKKSVPRTNKLEFLEKIRPSQLKDFFKPAGIGIRSIRSNAGAKGKLLKYFLLHAPELLKGQVLEFAIKFCFVEGGDLDMFCELMTRCHVANVPKERLMFWNMLIRSCVWNEAPQYWRALVDSLPDGTRNAIAAAYWRHPEMLPFFQEPIETDERCKDNVLAWLVQHCCSTTFLRDKFPTESVFFSERGLERTINALLERASEVAWHKPIPTTSSYFHRKHHKYVVDWGNVSLARAIDNSAGPRGFWWKWRLKERVQIAAAQFGPTFVFDATQCLRTMSQEGGFLSKDLVPLLLQYVGFLDVKEEEDEGENQNQLDQNQENQENPTKTSNSNNARTRSNKRNLDANHDEEPLCKKRPGR